MSTAMGLTHRSIRLLRSMVAATLLTGTPTLPSSPLPSLEAPSFVFALQSVRCLVVWRLRLVDMQLAARRALLPTYVSVFVVHPWQIPSTEQKHEPLSCDEDTPCNPPTVPCTSLRQPWYLRSR